MTRKPEPPAEDNHWIAGGTRTHGIQYGGPHYLREPLLQRLRRAEQLARYDAERGTKASIEHEDLVEIIAALERESSEARPPRCETFARPAPPTALDANALASWLARNEQTSLAGMAQAIIDLIAADRIVRKAEALELAASIAEASYAQGEALGAMIGDDPSDIAAKIRDAK